MNTTMMVIAGLVLLLASGLVTWAWFAMAQMEDDLRSFSGFEGKHFEIGSLAAHDSEGPRWAVPG